MIYVAGSMISGCSQDAGQPIAARAFQGIGVGGLQALVQVVIASIIPPRERGRYNGYLGAVMAVTTVGGPLLGGLIVDVPWSSRTRPRPGDPVSGGAAGTGAFESTVERFGPRPDPATQAVFVGVDGSDTAIRAAVYAFGMARRQHNRLIVAFAACQSPLAALSLAVVGTADVHEATMKLYTELRDQVASAADELEVPVTLVKVFGDPYTTLRDNADRCHVDPVVVGAPRQAGHRFAGSVATKLIRAGHWPVLVVP